MLSQSLNIKGSTSAGCDYKLFLYADDILAILDSISFSNFIKIVQYFGKYSGYKVN